MPNQSKVCDGSTVKQSFGYTLDDDGTITRITHEDGSYWDYGYDGRNRLISADRKSASTNIIAEYDYTYDDADNMLTKVEPFEDDFEDANYTGWTVLNGTWSASSKALIKTDNGWGNVAVLSDDADNEIRFDYRFTDISGADMGQVVPRYLSGNDNLAILIAPGAIILYSTVSGTATTLDYQTFSTVEDQWYTLRVESDGTNVTVWRSTEGELETEVLSTTSAAPTTTDAVLMGIVNTTMSNSPFELDNIRILVDDLENSTTFAYNTANELTSMTGPNGTTTFTYDDWGRQTAKTLNGVTDTYGYRYHGMLHAIDKNNDSNIDVTYEYGGDGRRRSRTAASEYEFYRWRGWSMISAEDVNGDIAKWYIPLIAQVNGSPETEDYAFIFRDHKRSTRSVFDESKSADARIDYDPYGKIDAKTDRVGISHLYEGKLWDPLGESYYFPLRVYTPHLARWQERDPIGMIDGPNLYRFLENNPISRRDPLGTSSEETEGEGDACPSCPTADQPDDSVNEDDAEDSSDDGEDPVPPADDEDEGWWDWAKGTAKKAAKGIANKIPKIIPKGPWYPKGPITPVYDAATSPEVVEGILTVDQYADEVDNQDDNTVNDPARGEICYGIGDGQVCSE